MTQIGIKTPENLKIALKNRGTHVKKFLCPSFDQKPRFLNKKVLKRGQKIF